MLLYKYSKETNEYIGSFPAYLDPLESQLQGREIIVVPPESTKVAPPEFGEREIPVFNKENNTWTVEKDFRGTSGFNKRTGEPIYIESIGDLPKDFTLEKPVLLVERKAEKLHELNLKYKEELSRKVEIEGVYEKSEDTAKFRNMLGILGDQKFITYFNKNEEVITLTKEKLEKIIKFLYLRSVLLPIVKTEIAGVIRGCKSKKQLDNLEIDFKLEERINELISCSEEEINSYIEEHTK